MFFYPGTFFFFGLLAVALAATISVDNQTESLSTEDLGVSADPTSISPTYSGPDKGFWEWVTGIITGSNSSPVTEATDVAPPQFPKNCPQCKCGLTNTHNRIVGGMETKENQYPWMVTLQNHGRFYCGGSVITSRHILTAAHCIDGFDKKAMTVSVLEHARDASSNSKVKRFKVQDMMKHPGYSTLNYNNDAAVITLDGEIKFDTHMKPVCLPPMGETFSGKEAIVTGWGALAESGAISNTLQEVDVRILSNMQCRSMKYPARRITDNMLCAGVKEGGKDSCQGDSGGPLHVINESVHSIVGIVSWGEGCAAKGYPGVYTRVNRFLTWIKRNTPNACYC